MTTGRQRGWDILEKLPPVVHKYIKYLNSYPYSSEEKVFEFHR